MSYFAVFHARPDGLHVTHCHINIWVSSKRWKPQCLFDVGLGLQATGNAIENATLQLALPFYAPECEDIETLLHDVSTASLVFGEHMGVTQQSTAQSLQGPTVELVLSSCATNRSSQLDRTDGCIWEISPHVPIGISTPTYVRLRFRVPFKAIWKPDRSGGALLDFRIADTREALAHEKWKGLSKFVAIKSVNIFAIAPSVWGVESNNPQFSYVRVLEQEVWRKYLGKDFPSFGGRMLVRHWKHKASDGEIGPARPYTAFMQLREAMRDQLSRAGARVVFWTSIITSALVLEGGALVEWIVNGWGAATGFIDKGEVVVKALAAFWALHYTITSLRHAEWVRDRIVSLRRSRR